MGDLTMRALAAKYDREAKESLEPARATELQEVAAREVGRIADTEVDPLRVDVCGYQRETDAALAFVTVDGHRFRFEARWGGGDWRYGTNWTWIEVRRGLLRRSTWVRVSNLADVGEALTGDKTDG